MFEVLSACSGPFSCFIIISFIVLFFAVPASARPLTGFIVLKGGVDLTYNRSWASGPAVETRAENTSQVFSQTYRLSLDTVVLDRRLILVHLDGSFHHSVKIHSESVRGRNFSGRIDLLDKKPRYALFTYIPSPIILTFSNSVSTHLRYSSFGLSLTYAPIDNPLFRGPLIRRIQEEAMAGRKRVRVADKKQNEEDEDEEPRENNGNQGRAGAGAVEAAQETKPSLLIPYPIIYLDFMRYRYVAFDLPVNSEMLDIRAESRKGGMELLGEYSYSNVGGIKENTSHNLDLRADLNYDYDKAARRLRIVNTVDLYKRSETKSFTFSNSTSLRQLLGSDRRDAINMYGGGGYFRSDTNQAYSLSAGGSYRKVISTAATDTVSVHLGYGGRDTGSTHSITANNNLTYFFSRGLVFSSVLMAGQTELGSSLGASLGLSANLQNYMLGTMYAFSSASVDEGKNNAHAFNVYARGVLARNLSLSSSLSYHISDTEGLQSHSSRGYSLRGNMAWNVWRLNINVGANHSSVTQDIAEVSSNDSVKKNDFSTTSFSAGVSSLLSRNLYAVLTSSYSTDSSGNSLIEIHPKLFWSYRALVITAEYQMFRVSGSNLLPSSNHMVKISVSRLFYRKFRPLF